MRALLVLLASITASTAAQSAPSLNAQSAPKGKYTLEPSHSVVMFCVRHMGISNYCGRFSTMKGALNFNGSQPDKSSASIELDVASVDTPSNALDNKLKSELFEVSKFPTASFVTKSISISTQNKGSIKGTLVLHGKAHEISLDTTFNGGLMHPMANAYTIGFSAQTTIKLSDYAFPDVAWKSFVTDEILLTIEAEFIAEK